jgi:hypothetical protein
MSGDIGIDFGGFFEFSSLVACPVSPNCFEAARSPAARAIQAITTGVLLVEVFVRGEARGKRRRGYRGARLGSRCDHATGSEMSRLGLRGGILNSGGGLHAISRIVSPMCVMFNMSWL